MSLFCPLGLVPDLDPGTQAVFRVAYAVLLLGTLVLALPHARRFFLSERWGGYAQSSPAVDALHNPLVLSVVLLAWVASGVLLLFGVATPWAALVNLVFCYHFFIRMRWKGVARGMGAPGFMTYWLAAAVFLLEGTTAYAPAWRGLALLVLQADFAFIMLSAGIYKLTAGYAHNHGMEFGMVNPMWGYWHHFYRRLPPGHVLFRTLNQLAWGLEVVSAVLMLWPTTRFLGAVLMATSFVFIGGTIRLGLLAHMVILCCVLFIAPGTVGAVLLAPVTPAAEGAGLSSSVAIVEIGFALALGAYLVLLPLAHAGLFYNFYARRSLPRPLQRALEVYTNAFGIIIWRVFSADHTSFLIRIYHERPEDPESRTLLSEYGRIGGRFNHVAESITVTSLFTTLVYYPSNRNLFHERLLRYARTLPCPAGADLVFEYVRIRKNAKGFAYVPVAEYRVLPQAGRVHEQTLADADRQPPAPHRSPVHEGVRPGSYVPLRG
jgi:hypothetical protein